MVRKNHHILPAAGLSAVALLMISIPLAPVSSFSFSFSPSTVAVVAATAPSRRDRLPPRLAVSATSSPSSIEPDNGDDDNDDGPDGVTTTSSNDAVVDGGTRGLNRREALLRSSSAASSSLLLLSAGLAAPAPSLSSVAVAAGNSKSRTAGYEIRRTEAEWSDLLSPAQYFVLRNGGTESPYSSILEGEERPGTYACAGCGTPLFDAGEKFHSGTGWPSFARPIGNNVETEDVSRVQYQLAGAEVRCQKCGGHLGDVFADGFLLPGTPALAFVPEGRGTSEVVMGDRPPPVRRNGPAFPG